MDLRPRRLDDVIGQEQAKNQLRISIQACLERGTVFPHLLITGPQGTGKTTLSEIIAEELGQKIEICSGPNLRSVKALLPYLSRIEYGSILFCDEIHKVSPLVQTYLLTVIEQFRYTLGKESDGMTMELPEFTFVAATTNSGPLLPPLINRFTYHYQLQPYSIDELAEIVLRNSQKLNLNMGKDCARIVAGSSRKTPRTSVNRLRWIHDYVTAKKISTITADDIIKCLHIAGIGLDGTEPNDRKYIKKLKEIQPASLNTISSAISIDMDTVEKTIEPFLVEKGWITKTRKGRICC